MPNVSEGIETGDEREFDLDTDAGFNARMAAKVAEKNETEIPERAKALIESLKESDRTVASGLTFDEESARRQVRDSQGRFTKEPAALEDEQKPDEGAAPAAEEREETADPIQGILERLEGDERSALETRLKEFENAQELIGRQGSELGERRQREQELAERVARLEGRAESQPTQYAPPPSFSDLEERLADGDFNAGHDAWDRAIEYVKQTGDASVLDQVKDVWKEYDPGSALEAWFEFREFVREAQVEAEREKAAPTSTSDSELDKIVAERRFNTNLDAARTAVGLSEKAQWSVVSPHLEEALKEAHPRVLKLVGSSDPEDQRDGLELVLKDAKARAITQATATATGEATAEQERAKRAASVATGSLRPAPERQPVSADDYETRRQEAVARFKQRIMEAPSTSVLDNITYEKVK